MKSALSQASITVLNFNYYNTWEALAMGDYFDNRDAEISHPAEIARLLGLCLIQLV